jgi:hypothetical protein
MVWIGVMDIHSYLYSSWDAFKEWVMVTIAGPADLAWIYKKGSNYTIGLNLNRFRSAKLDGPGDYGIATFKLNAKKKFESAGHVYIRFHGDEDHFGRTGFRPGVDKRLTMITCYVLKSAKSRWYYGTRTETCVTVHGIGFEDVTEEYEKAAKEAIDESMSFVEKTSDSNESLVRMFSNGHNHYTDLGFARFAQRRDGHHSIVTSGCAGIPELTAHQIGPKTWDECCKLSTLVTGYDAARFDTITPDQNLNVLDELACIALASTGFMYQWNLEPFDSICLPAVVFGTMQDCEDNGTAVVAAFNWLVKQPDEFAKTPIGKRLHNHLKRMGEKMRLVAGYVDVSIANPEAVDPSSISGHAWAVMYLKDDYRPDKSTRVLIIEGTDPFYIKPSTNDDAKDTSLASELYGGVIGLAHHQYPRCTYDSPKLQPLHRYKTVDVEFGPKSSEFVGRKGPKTFSVGLTIDEFVRGGFDRHPTASPETTQKVLDRWGDFVLSPSIPSASRLFDTFPDLRELYKLSPSDYKPILDEVEPKVPMSAVSAFDIKTKIEGAPGYIRGIPIELPFATILVVPSKTVTVSR